MITLEIKLPALLEDRGLCTSNPGPGTLHVLVQIPPPRGVSVSHTVNTGKPTGQRDHQAYETQHSEKTRVLWAETPRTAGIFFYVQFYYFCCAGD
jgi:hypothetical protein